MLEFYCNEEDKTFKSEGGQFSENQEGLVLITAEKECPHCGDSGHKLTMAVEQLESRT